MLAITTDDIARRLRADNPWWAAPSERSEPPMSWPRRAYYIAFREMLKQPVQRAVVLMGARRVGKTTLLHQLIGDASHSGDFGELLYASVDAPTFSSLRLDDILDLFLRIRPHDPSGRRLVVFDEIQYFPDWERHLKDLVDRYPSTKFVASGSAGAALKRKSTESGAGRFTDFELPPLNFSEFLDFTAQVSSAIDENGRSPRVLDFVRLNNLFVDYVNVGGYPEVVRNRAVQANMAQFVKSDIVDKVLLRDLPSLYGITNIPELNKLFMNIAYNTGQLVSLEGLSKNSGITKPTITRYLEYLEAAFLIVRLRRVDATSRRFTRERSFKVYLTNPSMRAALFGPVGAQDDAMGALAETAVVTQYLHSEIFRELFFANWKSGEIDMVRVSPQHQRPEWILDVKWSDGAPDRPEDWSAMLEFARDNGLKAAWMTSKTIDRTSSRGSIRCRVMPVALFAYLVGKGAATPGRLLSRYGLPEPEDAA